MICALSKQKSNLIQYTCGVAITYFSWKANPRYFTLAAIVGLFAQHSFPELVSSSQDSHCASGCSGIIGQSLGIKLNPQLSSIVGTILFCGHIGHCKDVSAITVGTLYGLRITHFWQSMFSK